ncbi:hypothetical protein TorRG33x02_038270 [Trema orientale]|uniref:Uncharacterized protein n=1 Tax=Trema orientale TaxID=63057 RepID=A0A2P5FRN3_TREOI|nr:hypothetical protein TorRG33x02_038270 [Trema orientale]
MDGDTDVDDMSNDDDDDSSTDLDDEDDDWDSVDFDGGPGILEFMTEGGGGDDDGDDSQLVESFSSEGEDFVGNGFGY